MKRMVPWSLCYVMALLVSFGSTLGVFIKMFRHRHRRRHRLQYGRRPPRRSEDPEDLECASPEPTPQLPEQECRHSAVQSVLLWLFWYLMLWSLFRVFCFVVLELHGRDHERLLEVLKDSRRLFMGPRGMVIHSGVVPCWWLTVLMILGDTCLVAASFWLFPLTHELFRLARFAMDRGPQKEKVISERYCLVVHSALLMFALVQLAVAIWWRGYCMVNMYIDLFGQSCQLLCMVDLAVTLAVLKCKGRQFESVHGQFVVSPLYNRIKNLLLVFFVFSFQFQITTFLCVFVWRGDVEVLPFWMLAVSSLLFRLLGAALAFVMGCSLECFVHCFRRCLPKEFSQDFCYLDAGWSSDSDRPSHQHNLALRRTLVSCHPPPRKNPVFVFTDIECSSELWACDDSRGTQIMRFASELHDDLLRLLLWKYHGYEITTVGDSFHLAFAQLQDAVDYCVEVQQKLLQTSWPKELHKSGIAAARRERFHGHLVFNGLRVRMGIHDAQEATEGVLVTNIHPIVGNVTYTGLSEVIASEVSELGHGGQVLMTSRVAAFVSEQHKTMDGSKCRAELLGRFDIGSINEQVDIHELIWQGSGEARHQYFHQIQTGMQSKRPVACNPRGKWTSREQLALVIANESKDFLDKPILASRA